MKEQASAMMMCWTVEFCGMRNKLLFFYFFMGFVKLKKQRVSPALDDYSVEIYEFIEHPVLPLTDVR